MLLAVLGLVVFLARASGIGQRLGDLRSWIESLGVFGPVVFVFLYALAVVAAVPGSALTVTAGVLFGSLLGVVIVSLGSTLGASLAFLISRYFARETVSRWLSRNERFRQLDQLTEQRGAIIVALTRLVPLFPFNLLNYGFGLTRIPFKTYVFWSWLCMLPGTAVFVMGGDAFTRTLSRSSTPWKLFAGMAILGVLLTVIVRFARRQLKA
ncbi:MAG: TVP38/TMEM64 family protein [Terriglobia bacterium]